MRTLTASVPAQLRVVRPGFFAVCFAAPVLLALSRLLPAEDLGLAVRLAAAGACVFLVPGAVILRALGWPSLPSLALAASIALSLGVLFCAFAFTFAVNGPAELVPGLVAVVTLAAVVPAVRRRALVPRTERADLLVLLGLAAAGVVLAGVVWWSSPHLPTGDALFHLARTRRMAEADSYASVSLVNEFRDGGLHPGYAFPLWHGALGVIARMAGVDAGLVVLHFASFLVPVALGVAYAAGRALFASWPGGLAVAIAQVGLVGFTANGVGELRWLALPGSATRVILAPVVLALVFAFLRSGSRSLLVPLAAGALVVTAVHGSYVILLGIPLLGFAAVALAVLPGRRTLAVRMGLAAGAAAVPTALFLAWLWPAINDFASYRTVAEERARALAHYGPQLQSFGDSFRVAPGRITQLGAVMVAGLAALPLAGLAIRRRWGAFVVGGMLLTLAVLLVPAVFTPFTDAISVSQGRRLALFLPIPFALAGAAVFAGRARIPGVVVALGAGIALSVAYTAERAHATSPGPTWPLWIGILGCAAAVPVAFFVPRVESWSQPTRWAPLAAAAFVLPVAVAGFQHVERIPRDPDGLTPGLVQALDRLPDDAVVLARVETAHRALAWSTVYVVATIPHHVADTGANRPYRRQRDAIRFFSGRSSDAERRATLERYGADWVLVDKRRPYPEAFVAGLDPVYEDRRYLLLSVPS